MDPGIPIDRDNTLSIFYSILSWNWTCAMDTYPNVWEEKSTGSPAASGQSRTFFPGQPAYVREAQLSQGIFLGL